MSLTHAGFIFIFYTSGNIAGNTLRREADLQVAIYNTPGQKDGASDCIDLYGIYTGVAQADTVEKRRQKIARIKKQHETLFASRGAPRSRKVSPAVAQFTLNQH